MKVDRMDVEELVCDMFKIDIESDDCDEIMDDKLNDEFGIGIEEFTCIVEKLLPYSRVVQSELTGEKYKSFGKQITDTMFESIVKSKIEEEK